MLRLTIDGIATRSNVPASVIELIEQGTGTVEDVGKLLGVLELKLGVVRPPAPGSARPASVGASRDKGRRIGIAKGVFDVPEGLSYSSYDAEWEAMPDVGLEAWPACSSDTAARAKDQAMVLRDATMRGWTGTAWRTRYLMWPVPKRAGTRQECGRFDGQPGEAGRMRARTRLRRCKTRPGAEKTRAIATIGMS